MAYSKKTFVNDTTPAIDASYLNGVENELEFLDTALTSNNKSVSSYTPDSKTGFVPIYPSIDVKNYYWYKNSQNELKRASANGFEYVCISINEIGKGLNIHFNNIASDYSGKPIVGFTASNQLDATVIDYLTKDNIINGYHDIPHYDSSTKDCVLLKSAIQSYIPTATYIWINVYYATDYILDVSFYENQSTNEKIFDLSSELNTFESSVEQRINGVDLDTLDTSYASYSPDSKIGLALVRPALEKTGKKYYRSSGIIKETTDANFKYLCIPLSKLKYGLLIHYNNISTDYSSVEPMAFTATDELGATAIDYLSVNNITNGYHNITHYNSTTKDCVISKDAIVSFKPTTQYLWINLHYATDYAYEVTFYDTSSVNEKIASISNMDSLPDFVTSAGNATFKRIMDWANGNPFTMIAQITDVHTAGTEKYKAVGYLNELNKLFGFDLIGNFGDIGLDTSSETETNGWEMLYNTKKRMDATSPWFYCKGNHDFGRVLLLTDSELDNIFTAPFVKQLFLSNYTSGKCYQYIDLPLNKIRVINVNTSETRTDGGYKITTTQLRWIAETLASVETGWNVVIVSHMCVDDCGRWNSYPTDASSDNFVCFRSILEDFVTKSSGSKTVEGTSITWDFTNVDSDCKLVCSFAGDSHFNNDAVTNGVQYIVRQGYGTIASSEMPEGATYDSFDYTTQCCFDVLCIKNDGNAKVFRIGAGGSTRDFSFTY